MLDFLYAGDAKAPSRIVPPQCSPTRVPPSQGCSSAERTRNGRLHRSAKGGLWIFVLVVTFLLLSDLIAAPVQAQTYRDYPTLVSNVKSSSPSRDFYVVDEDESITQSFTTGSHPAGYRASSFQFKLRNNVGRQQEAWIDDGSGNKLYSATTSNSTQCPTVACNYIWSNQYRLVLQPSTTYRAGFTPREITMYIYHTAILGNLVFRGGQSQILPVVPAIHSSLNLGEHRFWARPRNWRAQ